MDRFSPWLLGSEFRSFFFTWPILTDFILAPHGGHVGWGWENLTSHTRDVAGMTLTRLKHHISIVLTQLHLLCPSIQYWSSFFLEHLLSCQPPCPTAALQVLDSKVTGTANCMGLGFESWWQPRNVESELHEIRKPMLQTADKVAPAPFRLCFCHLTTRNNNIQIIFKLFKSKAIYTQESWHFRLDGKEGLLVGLLVQHGFLDDFCFNVLHVEPWTNKNHTLQQLLQMFFPGLLWVISSYFYWNSLNSVVWIFNIPNPETWTLLVAPLSLPCQGEPA